MTSFCHFHPSAEKDIGWKKGTTRDERKGVREAPREKVRETEGNLPTWLKKTKKFVGLFNISDYLCGSKVVVEMVKGWKMLVLPFFLLVLFLGNSIGRLSAIPFPQPSRLSTPDLSIKHNPLTPNSFYNRSIRPVTRLFHADGRTCRDTGACPSHSTTSNPFRSTPRPAPTLLFCRLLI